MGCYLSPNGQQSVLAPLLDSRYGPEVTARVMTYLRSDAFQAKYGPTQTTPTEPSFQLLPSLSSLGLSEGKLREIYENYTRLMGRKRGGKEVNFETFVGTVAKHLQVFHSKDTYFFGEWDEKNQVFKARMMSSPNIRELYQELDTLLGTTNVMASVPSDIGQMLEKKGMVKVDAGKEYNFKGEEMTKNLYFSSQAVAEQVFGKPLNTVTTDEVKSYDTFYNFWGLVKNLYELQEAKPIQIYPILVQMGLKPRQAWASARKYYKLKNSDKDPKELDKFVKDLIETIYFNVARNRVHIDKTDTLNKPEDTAKLNTELNKVLARFMSSFGVTTKVLSDYTEDSFEILNVLEKTLTVKESQQEDYPQEVGYLVAYMMQFNPTMIDILRQLKKVNKFKGLSKDDLLRAAGDLIAEQLHKKTQTPIPQSLSDLIAKLWEQFLDFLNRPRMNTLYKAVDEITDRILAEDQALIKSSNFKPGEIGKSTKIVTGLQDALDQDEDATRIVNKLAPLFNLAGSIALSEQGTVLRPQENQVHDLDWASDYDETTTKKHMAEAFPDSVLFRRIEEKGKKPTISYWVPKEGTKVNVLTYGRDGLPDTYSVTNAEGEVIGTGTRKTHTGEGEPKIVDFFIDSKPSTTKVITLRNGQAVTLAGWQAIFEAKLRYGRIKDIWDYNRFTPLNTSGEIPLYSETMEPTLEWVENVLFGQDDREYSPDSRIELKPGVYANEGQTKAIRQIEAFLQSRGSEDPMDSLLLLEGGAGVGKTTTINAALQKTRGLVIGGATVSDEARGVLQRNMVGFQTFTMASLLGKVPDSETGEFIQVERLDKNGKRKPFKIETLDVIVIDEASMITDEDWGLILEWKKPTAKIVFMGDRTQVEPIGQDLSKVFTELEKTRNYIRLTEPMRYAQGAPIYKLTEVGIAEKIWNGDTTFPITASSVVDDVTESEGVFFRNGNAQLVVDNFMLDYERDKSTVMIAGKNESVAKLNELIRGRLYGENAEPFQVGERVRFAGPFIRGEGETAVVVAQNNTKATILKKEDKEIDKYGFQDTVQVLTMSLESVDIMGKTVFTEEEVYLFTPKQRATLKKLKDQAFKTKDYSTAYSLVSLEQKGPKLDYAYAMTVHKVQGSTYSTVHVFPNDIEDNQMWSPSEKVKMLRTATSRARHKLVIYTKHSTDRSPVDKVFSPDTSSTPKGPTPNSTKPTSAPTLPFPSPTSWQEDGKTVYQGKSPDGNQYYFEENGPLVKGFYRNNGTNGWKAMTKASTERQFENLTGRTPVPLLPVPAQLSLPVEAEVKKFDTEDDAIEAVEGIRPDGTFGGATIPTGTVIEIAGKRFTVVNDNDKDIQFLPVGAPPPPPKKVERTTSMIIRKRVQENPTTLYVFGDNDTRKGFGGQAKEMRGEPNAFGISTKKRPDDRPDSFKSDTELEENKRIIREDIDKVIEAWKTGKYTKLVIPQVGVGKAELPTRAPQTYQFLLEELQRLEDFVHSYEPDQGTQQKGKEVAINISSDDPNGFEGLSNFAARPFTFGGVNYNSVEQAYQHAKAVFAEDFETATKILATKTGKEAKKIGLRKVEGWETQSPQIMRTLMKASFDANPTAVQLLLSTGNAKLTHNIKSKKADFWTEEFPKILTELRKEYTNPQPKKEETTKLAPSSPLNPTDTATPLSLPQGKGSKKLSDVTAEDVKEAHAVVASLVKVAQKSPDQVFVFNVTNPATMSFPDHLGMRGKDYVDIMTELKAGMGETFPQNLLFYPAFEQAMLTSSRSLVGLFAKTNDQLEALNLSYRANPVTMSEMRSRMEISISSPEGVTQDFFATRYSAEMQADVEGHLAYIFFDKYKNGEIRPADVLQIILHYLKYQASEANRNLEQRRIFQDVLASFAFPDGDIRQGFLDVLLGHLSYLGYTIPHHVRVALKNHFAVSKFAPMPDIEQGIEQFLVDIDQTTGWESTAIGDEGQDLLGEFDDDKAQMLRDWQDSAFERNSLDLATARLKIFVANTTKTESFDIRGITAGKLIPPRSINLKETFPRFQNVTDEASFREAAKKMTVGEARAINKKSVYLPGIDGDVIHSVLVKQFPSLPIRSSLAGKVLVDFNKLWDDLKGILSDQYGLTTAKAIELLESKQVPALREFANRLKKISDPTSESYDPQTAKEFIKIMHMQNTNFMLVQSKWKKQAGKDVLETRIMDAQRYDRIKVLIENWKQSLKLSDMVTVGEDGRTRINTEYGKTVPGSKHAHVEVVNYLAMAADLRGKNPDEIIARMSAKYEELKRTNPTAISILGFEDPSQMIVLEELNPKRDVLELQRVTQKRIVSTMFQAYGISLSPEALDRMAGYKIVDQEDANGAVMSAKVDLISSMIPGTGFTNESWLGQFKATATDPNKPNGIMAAFFFTAAGLVEDESSDSEEDDTMSLNNPLLKATTSVSILASYQSDYETDLYNKVHVTLEGKKNWDYAYHTLLSQTVLALNNNHDNFKTNMVESVWGSLPILNSQNQIKLSYMEGLKVSGKPEGRVRERMSDREQLLTSLLFFQNKGRTTANYMSMTHSDKTMTPVFSNIQRYPTYYVNPQTGVLDFSPQIMDAFYSTFLGEYRRIKAVQKSNKEGKLLGSDAMKTSGQYFFFFPSLNQELLSPELQALLYDGKEIRTDLDKNPEAIKAIKGEIRKYLQTIARKANEYAVAVGVTEELLDRDYLTKLQRQTTVSEQQLKLAMGDYALNSLLWNMNSSAVLFGDPANIEWKGSLQKTLAEYAKRLAKDIAPGYQTEWENPLYNELTLEDVSPVYQYLKDAGSNIHQSKGTDGQELTTVQEHLDCMWADGKLSAQDYQELSRKAEEEEDFSPEELARILKPMQAMKPVYSGHRFQGSLVYTDYIKTSSFPLLPQFTRTTELDKLRLLMEGKLVPGQAFARATYKSGSKMGHSKAVKVFDDNERFVMPTSQALSVATRVLNRKNFRIQQEVPYEESKTEIGILTQMDKLLMNGILDIDGFKYRGESLNGKSIRTEKERIRGEIAKRNLQELKNELGVEDDLSEVHPTKVLKLLLKAAREKEYSPNDLMLLESLITDMENGNSQMSFPLFFHSASERVNKLLMAKASSIKDFKMPGHSYVQASSVGFRRLENLSDRDKMGIITVGDYNADIPLRHMELVKDEHGNMIVKPAQVILPFNFHDSEGNKLRVKDFLIPGTNQLDMTKVPKELLQMVAGRVPNQGFNSMMALEVVGFTPEWMADLMIVPSPITGQMGADFDVDKLYVYQRPYTLDPDTNELSPKVHVKKKLGANQEEYKKWESDVKKYLMTQAKHNPDQPELQPDSEGRFSSKVFKDALGKYLARLYPNKADIPKHEIEETKESDATLRSKYFDIHWAVLTHKDLYNKILNQLDKPDLSFEETGANTIFAEQEEAVSTFFSAVTQLQNFQGGKDAKAMVGLTSLGSTNSVYFQNKSLRLGYYFKTYDEDGNFTGFEQKEDPLVIGDLELLYVTGESQTNPVTVFVGETPTPMFNAYNKVDVYTVYQSGAVDNAKDRNLDNLNINTLTWRGLHALSSLHSSNKKSLPVLHHVSFTVQPIIRVLVDRLRRESDQLTREFDQDAEEKVYKDLKESYTKLAIEAGRAKEIELTEEQIEAQTENVSTDYETLYNTWKAFQDGTAGPDEYMVQLKVLSTWKRLSDIGGRLMELQKTFNQDTKGAGPSLPYALQQIDKHNNLYSESGKIFLDEASLVDGQAEAMFQSIIPTAVQLLSSVNPVNTYQNVADKVAKLTGKTASELSERTMGLIHKHMRAYALTKAGTSNLASATDLRHRLLYKTEKEESLAQRVQRAKALYPKNIFLASLRPKINSLSVGPHHIDYRMEESGRIDSNKLVLHFAQLLMSEDKVLNQLGSDLVTYALITSGQGGTNTFLDRIPAGLILGSHLAATLRSTYEEIEALDDMPDGFLSQFVQHNPHLAQEIGPKLMDRANKEYAVPGRDYPEILELPANNTSSIQVEDKNPTFLSFRSGTDSKTILFKYQQGDGNTVTYQRIDTLGEGPVLEYDNTVTGISSSLFPDNKSMYDYKEVSALRALDNEVGQRITATADKENACSRWGLEKGTFTDEAGIQVVLEQMSADSQVPTYLRTLGGMLAETSENAEELEARLAMHMPMTPLIMGVHEGGKGSWYSSVRNQVSLKASRSITRSANNLVHELLHSRSTTILRAMGYLTEQEFRNMHKDPTNALLQAEYQKYLAEAEKFKANHPELAAKISKLQMVRVEAYQAFKKKLEAEGKSFLKLAGEVKRPGEIEWTEDHEILYALGSITEFAVQSLTHQATMEFLNTVPSKQSFVEKVLQAVSDFLTAVLNSLGVNVNKNSLLYDAIYLSLDVSGLTAENLTRSQSKDSSIKVYKTETAARQAASISSLYLGRKSKVATDGLTHITYQADGNDEVYSLGGASKEQQFVHKILNNMSRQKTSVDALANEIGNSPETVARRSEAILYRDKLETDMTDLKASLELGATLESAKDQLSWVRNVLSKDEASIHLQELLVATDIINTWNTLTSVYDTIDEADIPEEVQELLNKINSEVGPLTAVHLKKQKKTLAARIQTDTDITVTPADMGIRLKDLNVVQQQVLALERDANQLSKAVTTFVQYKIQDAQSEKRDLIQTLKRFQKLVPASSYHKFFQESKKNSVFGLVQELAPEWYQVSAKINKRLQNEIRGMKGTKKETKMTKYAAELRRYWDNMNSFATALPLDKLIDPVTGVLLTTPEAQQVLADLKATHRPHLVDKALEEAVKDYNRYLELLASKTAEIRSKTQVLVKESDLTPGERVAFDALSDTEKADYLTRMSRTRTDAEINREIQSWVNFVSPLKFLATQPTPGSSAALDTLIISGKFAPRFIPKEMAGNFDQKFKDIQDDPKLKEGYEIIKELALKFKSYLPESVAKHMHDNFLPIVTLDQLAEAESFWAGMKSGSDLQRKMFTHFYATKEQIDRKKNRDGGLDLSFATKKVPKKKTAAGYEPDLDVLSQDLPRIFEYFGNMAIDYLHGTEANQVLETAISLVKVESGQRQQHSKEGLTNLLALMEYYQDMLIYKKPKEYQGVGTTPVYSAKASENKKLKLELDTLLKRQEELNTALLFNSGITDEEKEAMEKELKELEKRIIEIRAQARYIVGSQISDATISIAQLKAMSYNPMSGVANLAFGYLSTRTHARGFRANLPDGFSSGDFTNEQLTQAYALMRATSKYHIGKVFGAERNPTAAKIWNLIQKVGAIEALIDTRYGDSNLSEKESKLKSFFDPYGWQKSGDFLTKGATIVARALNTPVKVTVNGEEKTISLFEALNSEANWDTATYGTNEDWEKQGKNWNKYTLRTRKIMLLIFGNQDPRIPLMLRKGMIGRLLAQFKLSWIPEGIYTRWGGRSGYDPVLEREIEGRYRTMLRLGPKNAAGLLLKQVMSVFTKTDPFADVMISDTVNGETTYRKMQEFEIENMRRNLASMSQRAFLLALYLVLKGIQPDEEELKKLRRAGASSPALARLAGNLAYRTYQDVALYSSPSIFDQITGSPVPAWGVIRDVIKAGEAYKKIALEDDYTWEQFGLAHTKAVPFLNLINKYKFWTEKDVASAVR